MAGYKPSVEDKFEDKDLSTFHVKVMRRGLSLGYGFCAMALSSSTSYQSKKEQFAGNVLVAFMVDSPSSLSGHSKQKLELIEHTLLPRPPR